jgi:hypothetical protein
LRVGKLLLRPQLKRRRQLLLHLREEAPEQYRRCSAAPPRSPRRHDAAALLGHLKESQHTFRQPVYTEYEEAGRQAVQITEINLVEKEAVLVLQDVHLQTHASKKSFTIANMFWKKKTQLPYEKIIAYLHLNSFWFPYGYSYLAV